MVGVSDSSDLCRLAAEILKAGDLEAAATLFEKAVPVRGDCVEAHLGWARALMPGLDYIDILGRLLDFIEVKSYVEIGVEFGTTLKLVKPTTRAIGIDPAPQVESSLPENTSIYRCTSDNFFANNDLNYLLGSPFDLAFIDGLHVFEQVLRDFINLEKYAAPDSLVLIHDCLPLDCRTASRIRTTQFWSGDVWRIVPCLKRERPDLSLFTIPTYPAGLCLVGGLDAGSELLSKNYDLIVDRYLNLEYDTIKDKAEYFTLIDNNWQVIRDTISTTKKGEQDKSVQS
ncbi:class I SAM-dependent methyltransferase [bacterium]|nr:class I SAM-dependent methyltransferase [bacterium]